MDWPRAAIAHDTSGFGQNNNAGGFLNTTATTPTSSDQRKPERVTNIVPITIAKILLMPEKDEYVKFGSISAKIVRLIALVKSVDVQSTKVTYFVEDFTAPGIEVQMWVGENEEASKQVNVVKENSYVRVTGAVRSMKGKRHIIAFNVRPVESLNEISMHIAEVVHTSMSIAVMEKQRESVTGGVKSFGDQSMPMDTSSIDTYGSGRKLTKPQQLVKQAIMNCKDEQGLNVNEIYNQLKSLNRQSIQEALDFLSNEGHIYSTIDENHYKSTDCI